MIIPQAIEGSDFNAIEKRGVVQKPTAPNGLTLEAWSSGYLDGALIIMACITVANMRKGVLLHKVRIPRKSKVASLTELPACSS